MTVWYPWETRAQLNVRKRRQRLAAARRLGTHTKEEWRELLAEVDGVCVRCRSDEYHLEKDHIIPLYQGGSDGIENLQPLCARCNGGKGAETINWLAEWRGEWRESVQA